jgi:hypothetical protein
MKRSDDPSATREETADGSWLQRARAGGASRRHSTEGSGRVVNPTPQGPSQGWDPYEVWLSRIERPRRQRRDMAGT